MYNQCVQQVYFDGDGNLKIFKTVTGQNSIGSAFIIMLKDVAVVAKKIGGGIVRATKTVEKVAEKVGGFFEGLFHRKKKKHRKRYPSHKRKHNR